MHSIVKTKLRILAILCLFTHHYCIAQNIFSKQTKLMGCGFEITVVANHKDSADLYFDMANGEIKRIESIISSWNPDSETSIINRNAGVQPTKVSLELFQLIERSLKISELTQGAFDISFASMDKIWKFDDSMTAFPDSNSVKKAAYLINYKNIILNRSDTSVFLTQKGMKIGFGALGKGYAADKAKELLMQHKVSAGIINASGDLNTWGTMPQGTDWTVAIINPLNKEKVFSWLPIHNQAIVTSGNYENFVTFNNQLYSHIIDPRTGYPSKGIASVSIITLKAELADALATSVFVMGIDAGLDLINQLNGIECIIIDDKGNVIASNHIDLKHIAQRITP